VNVPPLRDRRDDISLLAQHFVQVYAEKNGKPIAGCSPAALERLTEYGWPGNVRELANAIERLTLLAEQGVARLDDLPAEVAGPAGSAGSGGSDSARRAGSGAFRLPPQGISWDEHERDMLGQALAQAAGNRSRAARLLDLPYKAFLYRLEKHGLAGAASGEAAAAGVEAESPDPGSAFPK
jgi:DNA-binding NtrC family response regulator